MKVKELIEFLSQFDDEMDLFIDKSVDGGVSDIQNLTKPDFYIDGDKIILGYEY